MESKLTDKQERFILAYIGEANFNATEASRIAGYSHPRQSGAENLSHVVIKQRINDHLEVIRATGIGNKAVRLAELSSLNDDLKRVQVARAAEAKLRYEQGEDIPEAAETGIMIEQTKQIGTGANAVTTTEWIIDKTLIDGRTKILEQAAKEVGDRDKRIELSGPNGAPIQVESAKTKLLELASQDGT